VILPIVIMAAVAGAGAQMPLKCTANTRVTEAIAGLIGDRSALADHLTVLAGDPVVAARQLIASLHVVADTHVAGYDQGRHRNTMRVIWALRALRYLTAVRTSVRRPARIPPHGARSDASGCCATIPAPPRGMGSRWMVFPSFKPGCRVTASSSRHAIPRRRSSRGGTDGTGSRAVAGWASTPVNPWTSGISEPHPMCVQR